MIYTTFRTVAEEHPSPSQAHPKSLPMDKTKDRQESSTLPCRSLNHMRMTRLLADSLSKLLLSQIQA